MSSDGRLQFPLNFKEVGIFETSASLSNWIDAVQEWEGPAVCVLTECDNVSFASSRNCAKTVSPSQRN